MYTYQNELYFGCRRTLQHRAQIVNVQVAHGLSVYFYDLVPNLRT
jgi:hypothetical protein